MLKYETWFETKTESMTVEQSESDGMENVTER